MAWPRPARAALTGFCAGLLDLPADEAGRLAAAVEDYSRRLPLTARAGLIGAVMGVDLLSAARTGHRLASLEPAARDGLLARMDDSAGRQVVEALKVPALLVHGARLAGPELEARNSAGPARPDADLDVVPAGEWPCRHTTDVVIVGSGAGGAVAARTLGRAGLRCVIVEEGRRWGVETFRTGAAIDRFAGLYRDGGATIALGRPPVALPIGRGVGGTTLVNSGTCYRTPRPVLERWRDEHGVELADPDRFAAHLDAIEFMLQVAPVPDAVMGRNGRLALRGAAELGWSSHPLRRNAPGCGGSCQCAIGCPRNAKYGVHLNALPDACAAGAVILSDARVERVLHGRGTVTGVRARRPDGSTLEILADHVVVAAGATESPPLLRRSGLGGHPQLGRNLAVHPALSTAGWFDEEVDSTRGVLQSVGIDQHHASRRILIEATSTPPGMGTMVLPGTGRRLADQLERAGHLATLGAMVADEPSGTVHGRSRAVLSYRLSGSDGRRLLDAVAATGRVLFAAGARSVLTGIPGHEEVRSEPELDDAVSGADIRRMHIAAFHPTGSLRMGRDPQLHPVDPVGRLRGASRVSVMDASVLPTCPEVNPQVTIMAMAETLAAQLAAELGASPA